MKAEELRTACEEAVKRLAHLSGGNAAVHRVRVESNGQQYVLTIVAEHADLRDPP